MTRFTMDQLDTLRAVVDEGGFEAAARRLHMTQSAVSQRIKQLERASGQVLLRRSTPVAPTAAGDVVLRYARQVDLLAAEALSELGGAEPSASPTTLAIAVNADSSATWFLEALAGMPPQLPVVFDLRRADQQHTAALLRSGDVLAAVTSTREAVQGCSSEALGTMRYRAVASPGYRDRWLGGVADVSRLDGAPMLVFDRTDELQHDFVRSAVGYDPRSPRHHVPASADFARAAVLGLGWGMLPEAQAMPEIDAGGLVELAPDRPVDVALFWQRWTLGSPALDALTESVRTTARTALHQRP
ncbi:LysR family transcriptional regulator ArgP [Frigoribacterium faeni]|uniref:LysR family transcriptional regulator (Chromosome initiation inhibitor) n=1 Tax=Frigoribacterium faeni TaxID=145483 RepID=A0A7W3JH84_9MICO|nr:LysR family transcriptional regulator ArgP [Frigoribacterium faeni]MBA8812749.1 LysR family transcriptional regulator (chromosome initiation inhibitor) [Frigoribacterium faeni]GEK82236.1 transcriptional regulator ArgP [Frigoribacterium faeni]